MSKRYDKSRRQPIGRMSGRFSSAGTIEPKFEAPERIEPLPEDIANLAMMISDYITGDETINNNTIEEITNIVNNEYITNILKKYYYLCGIASHGISISALREIAVDLADGATGDPVVYPGLAFTDTDDDDLGELHVDWLLRTPMRTK